MDKRKKVSQIAGNHVKKVRRGYLGTMSSHHNDRDNLDYSLTLEELMETLVRRIEQGKKDPGGE